MSIGQIGTKLSNVKRIQQFGNQLKIIYNSGRKELAVPANGLWLAKSVPDIPPVEPPNPGDGSIYNPWGVGRGDPLDGWESHASYSAGGYDWSFMEYGAGIPAPADGTLHTTGGSGEYAAGNMGSAGLRSILYLNTPVPRLIPASGTVMNGGGTEAPGPMAAIVFQHQSNMGEHGYPYKRGDIVGNVGDSGNGVKHLHVHGLDAEGRRVDFFKFCPPS